MDAVRFDTLARSLTAAGSRRRALAALSGALGLVLGASSVEEAAAKKEKCPPCKKPKKGKCKKKKPDGTACAGGTCQSGSCVSTAPPLPPPPVPVLTYQCSEPGEGSINASAPATTRFAQTFTAAQSGSLHQIQFLVFKPVGSTGDYVLELLAVADGKPTNTVLAQLSIPDTSVPDDSSTLTATFSGPPLVASTLYAAAISRPGGTDLTVETRTGNDCAGSVFTQHPSGTGTFTEFTDLDPDLVTSVIVLA